MISALLTAISAIFFAMYTRSIQASSHGNFYELYSIAAAVLGVVLLQMLQNLVNLLGIPSSLNFAVMGSVILLGVIADTQLAAYRESRRQSKALASISSATPSTPVA